MLRDVETAITMASGERNQRRREEVSKINKDNAEEWLDELEDTDPNTLSRVENRLRHNKIVKARNMLGIGKAGRRTPWGMRKVQMRQERRQRESATVSKKADDVKIEEEPGLSNGELYDFGATFQLPIRGA